MCDLNWSTLFVRSLIITKTPFDAIRPRGPVNMCSVVHSYSLIMFNSQIFMFRDSVVSKGSKEQFSLFLLITNMPCGFGIVFKSRSNLDMITLLSGIFYLSKMNCSLPCILPEVVTQLYTTKMGTGWWYILHILLFKLLVYLFIKKERTSHETLLDFSNYLHLH